MTVNDALALEHQAYYRTARSDLDIADLVNDPAASGVCSVLSLSLTEEGFDLSRGQIRSFFDH